MPVVILYMVVKHGFLYYVKEERRLGVLENRITRRVFGSRGMKMGSGESSRMKNIIVCTVHLIYSG